MYQHPKILILGVLKLRVLLHLLLVSLDLREKKIRKVVGCVVECLLQLLVPEEDVLVVYLKFPDALLIPLMSLYHLHIVLLQERKLLGFGMKLLC